MDIRNVRAGSTGILLLFTCLFKVDDTVNIPNNMVYQKIIRRLGTS
jgi:hypothetical protein